MSRPLDAAALAHLTADITKLRNAQPMSQGEYEIALDRLLLAAPALVAGCETLLDVERKYRLELWLHHGHHGVALYGDDGEMQCHVCRIWDYRRAPLADLELQVEDARRSQALAALDAAREEPSRA